MAVNPEGPPPAPPVPEPLPTGGPVEQVRWAVRLSRDVVHDEGLAEFGRRGAGILQRRWAALLEPRSTPTLPTRAARTVDRARSAAAGGSAALRTRPGGPAAAGTLLLVHDPASPVARLDRLRLWRDLGERLGHGAAVHGMDDLAACLAGACVADAVVLLDLPWHARTARIARQARAACRPVVAEITGPWHDGVAVAHDANLAAGAWPVRDLLRRQAPTRLRTLQEADAVVVPTEAMAALLRAEGAAVVPDAVDEDLVLWSRGVDADPVVRRWRSAPAPPTLAFAAGSPGWRADFASAEAALVRVLGDHPQVRVRLLGTGAVPDALVPFADRVERLPPLSAGNTVREVALSHLLVGRRAPTTAHRVRGPVEAYVAAAAGVPLVGAGAWSDSAELAAELLAALQDRSARPWSPPPSRSSLSSETVDRRALPAAAALVSRLGAAGAAGRS